MAAGAVVAAGGAGFGVAEGVLQVTEGGAGVQTGRERCFQPCECLGRQRAAYGAFVSLGDPAVTTPGCPGQLNPRTCRARSRPTASRTRGQRGPCCDGRPAGLPSVRTGSAAERRALTMSAGDDDPTLSCATLPACIRCNKPAPGATELGDASWHVMQPGARIPCHRGVIGSAAPAPPPSGGSSSPYGKGTTLGGECCIGCNSAHLGEGGVGVAKHVRAHAGLQGGEVGGGAGQAA